MIAWGNRRLDWSIFATAALMAALVAKWGHELPYLKCVILVLLQSAASLLLLFLLAFSFAELGWTEF